MQQITFKIPDARKFQFADDLTAWAKASYKDARLITGDAANPYETTTMGSPLVYTCNIDETFFEIYPEWRQYIVTAGGRA
jgi:hypothetical protein